MKVVVYIRVSTDEQCESGLGLKAQLEACERFADNSGLRIDEVFSDEGISGATPISRCSSLVQAVGSLHRGDVLLVAKRDRLARNLLKAKVLERMIENQGARLVSAAGEGSTLEDGDPVGELILKTMVDLLAEVERVQTAIRTKAALRVKAARGERVGSLPFGFALAEDGKTLIVDEDEQNTLFMIRQLRGNGWGAQRIAGELTRRGVKTKTGKSAWNRGTVRRIVERMEAA